VPRPEGTCASSKPTLVKCRLKVQGLGEKQSRHFSRDDIWARHRLQLTDPALWVHHARYSPDGKRIALMAKFPDRPWKIYWISADGGALHALNVPIASQADPNWTPDGQSIVFGQPPLFYAEPDSPRAIYVYNLLTNSTSKILASEG
jgi:Tol biopolymer transport system component